MSPSTLNPVEPPWYGPVCPVVWEGRHREVPPYPDMDAHPVQAALLEIVDRRLDGGMLLACQCEVRLRLVFAAARGQAALGGHGVEFQRVAEGGLVLRAKKAAVEAAGEEVREAFPRGFDDGNRSVRVAPRPQDPVLEDELAHWSSTIATGTPSSTGRPAFPLLIHRACSPKTEKTLLFLGDLLALQDPPVRLVDLALRMRDVPVEFLEFLRPGAPLQQAGPGGLRVREQFLALGQELVDVLPPGLRAPGVRHPLIQPPEGHRMMPGLTPTREVPFVRQLGRDPHHHPGCVPEQVAVRGIMDIRLDNKAVAPARQRLVGVMAAKAVAVPHHQFVYVSQRVLVEQRDIPHHLVIEIRHRVELAVPEQLAQHQVRVDVFMKPVEVQPGPCVSTASTRTVHSSIPGRPTFRSRSSPNRSSRSLKIASRSASFKYSAGQAGSPGCRPATSRQSGLPRSLSDRASAQNAPTSGSQTPTKRSRNPQRATPDHRPAAHRAPLPGIRSNSLYIIRIMADGATPETPRSLPEQPDTEPSRQVPDRSQRVLVQ